MESDICVSIDLSMRSTGIVRLTNNNKVIDFKIIASKLNDEELLNWNAAEIVKFTKKIIPSYIVIEGLSLKSKSPYLDRIFGNMWVTRCALRNAFGEDMRIGIIPVLSWRNNLLSKAERKEAKYETNGIKIAVVKKLPTKLEKRFLNYIKVNKLPKKSLCDLSDSFFLGVYRNKL